MALNLEAIFRITTKIRDEGLAKLSQGLEQAGKSAETAKKSFKNVTDSAAWQGAAIAAAGIGVALIASVRSAIEFESAVADVRKVVDGLESPEGLKQIRNEIIGLSLEMPIAAKGFAEIYAAAGQAGIPRREIQGFARDVAQMAVAFDMTAEDAGNAMAKLRSSLGLSQPQIKDLADALNFLSNNTASTGAQLVEFTKRSGAMGQMAGLTAEQTAAFGAAMIGAGVETEIAATSFNNMIRALSRGSSMTARQESALKRLGLASKTVVDSEKEMTSAVQRESDRRLEIMQDTNDRQMNELRKHYRRQRQLLEDEMDDENELVEDGINDQADAQIKALQKTADARIKALQKQSEGNEEYADAQADLIRDQLEKEIDAIRDATDDKLKIQRRADRDRRQEVMDSLEESADEETKILQRKLKDQQDAEKAATQETIASIKEAAASGGSEVGQALAKRLQADALGTIRDVLSRLKNLPPEERISVLSDLFGDEARGLAPMVNNLGALEKALLLIADKTKYAGSMTKEYEVRSKTTANALQLARNQVDALAIKIGEAMLPALQKLVEITTPVVAALGRFAEAHPGITAAVVAVTALAAGFVLLAPFIAAAVSLLAPLAAGIAAAVGGVAAWLAGWAAMIPIVLGGIKAIVLGAGAVVAAIGAWPILIGVAIAAAVAVVWTFRDQIGAFFQWVAQAAINGWNALVAPLRPLVASIVGIWNEIMAKVGAIFVALGTLYYQTFIEPVVVAARALVDILVGFWTATFEAISGIVTAWVESLRKSFEFIAKAYHDIVIKPIMDRATSLWGWLQEGWQAFSTTSQNIFRAIANTYNDMVVKPINNAWKGIVGGAQAALRGLMAWAARAINGVIDAVNAVIRGINRVRAAAGLSTYGTLGRVSVPAFAEGGFVDKPTLAMIGDNKGGREYAIPEQKVVGFANNILAGRRGPAAIPATSGSGGSRSPGAASLTLNLTTGPIRQDASGQRWMTIEDGERMLREGFTKMQRVGRTPSGRYSQGIR